MFLRKSPTFSQKHPTFSQKSPSFSGKSGTLLKRMLTLVAQPCDRCDRKKHKTLGICARTYALTRVKSFTPKDKTSLLSDSFPKLVIARPATPKEKVKYFTFPSLFFWGGYIKLYSMNRKEINGKEVSGKEISGKEVVNPDYRKKENLRE